MNYGELDSHLPFCYMPIYSQQKFRTKETDKTASSFNARSRPCAAMAQSPVLTTQDLNVLATTVLSEVQSYLESLKSRGIDSPSLTCSQDIRLRSDAGQPEVESSKRAIVRACEKVIALTQGPSQWLWMETSGHITTAALSIVLALKVQHHVSSDPAKPTSLDQLSVATGGSRDLLSEF